MRLAFHSKTPKALIIGVDSFTGRHLQSYLKKYDYDVYGTTLGPTDKDKMFQCDITDKSNVREILSSLKPEYIINLAGISFVGHGNKELFYKVNVLAAENILEAVLEVEDYKPFKTILVSSATVYGNQTASVLDESMTPNPVNHYGISKLAMEQIAKTYFDKINLVITRPFNYTGVGQAENFLIPKIVSHYKAKKETIELGNTNVFREFNDVNYVCEVYKRLFESDVSGEIVNIASNRTIALKDVIDHMNKIAGYEINIQINPEFVRKNEIVTLSGSPKKLFNLIGKVEQKDFIETLKEMYDD